MEKKKYYVSLQSKEIAQNQYQNNNDFVIYATDDEVSRLRKTFNEMHAGEISSFWRSHIPIMPYHNDKGNEQYDAGIKQAFQQIYALGNEASREFIKESGYIDE